MATRLPRSPSGKPMIKSRDGSTDTSMSQPEHLVDILRIDDAGPGQEVIRLLQPVTNVVCDLENGNVTPPERLLVHSEQHLACLDAFQCRGVEIECPEQQILARQCLLGLASTGIGWPT